jgi:hypothetical protein
MTTKTIPTLEQLERDLRQRTESLYRRLTAPEGSMEAFPPPNTPEKRAAALAKGVRKLERAAYLAHGAPGGVIAGPRAAAHRPEHHAVRARRSDGRSSPRGDRRHRVGGGVRRAVARRLADAVARFENLFKPRGCQHSSSFARCSSGGSSARSFPRCARSVHRVRVDVGPGAGTARRHGGEAAALGDHSIAGWSNRRLLSSSRRLLLGAGAENRRRSGNTEHCNQKHRRRDRAGHDASPFADQVSPNAEPANAVARPRVGSPLASILSGLPLCVERMLRTVVTAPSQWYRHKPQEPHRRSPP